MGEGTTLKWKRHRRPIARHESLTAMAGPPILVEARLAVPTPSDLEQDILLPELPDTPREKAVTLLRVASQIEHALMVQYLYAGYSFSTTQREIAGVAVEEMSHLMTVQNLLRCLNEPPYLQRQDYGAPAHEDERLFPFELRLEPASHLSLAKYIVAEAPAMAPAGVDPSVLAHIVGLATGPMGEQINRVGVLYALLGVVFGSEQMLLELAAEGDPWFVAVNKLAAEAADFYNGRDKLHLPDSAFDTASAPQQASDPDWDRSVEGLFDDFRVHVVSSRREALQALRDIGLQGEGPSTVATENSHFRRFYDLFVRFFGADGTGTNPPPGVMDVPAGSHIVLDENSSGDHIISNPTTVPWARLADLRYAILLGSLDRYLRASVGDRDFLRGWCFAEMFALKTLADLLRRMQRGVHSAAQVASLPFNLPEWLETGAQWPNLTAAFEESITIATDLSDQADLPPDQQTFLVRLLASDARKLKETTARAAGTTQVSRTDAVRDVLDWAAGVGSPRHDGNGRFWNLQHDELVQVTVFGDNITTPPSPGDDAPIVEMLRTQSMPQGRPKLSEDSTEFTVIESWVNDGCPE